MQHSCVANCVCIYFSEMTTLLLEKEFLAESNLMKFHQKSVTDAQKPFQVKIFSTGIAEFANNPEVQLKNQKHDKVNLLFKFWSKLNQEK